MLGLEVLIDVAEDFDDLSELVCDHSYMLLLLNEG